MSIYILGLVVFFGTHVYSATRSREPGRGIKERLGHGPYMGLYSLAALGGFALLVYGFGLARPSAILYQPPEWARHVTLALMLVAMILLISSYLPTGYLKRATKHPMITAVKVWAVSHLLSNGEVASVLLCVAFLGYAVLSRIMAKRRGDVGPGPDAAASLKWDIVAFLAGCGIYFAFAYYLHPILIGVPAIY